MIGLIIVIFTIVVIVVFFVAQKVKRKIKCPICDGSGKIWEEVHDSTDLQITNCSHCKGGEP